MTRFFAAFTVLLIHTGAAFAQQFPAEPGPLAQGPGTPPPAPSPAQGAPVVGPPAPAAAPAPLPPPPPPPPAAAAQSEDYPPGYGPPPGYSAPPAYGAPPVYGAPPMYGQPPAYGPPPGYGRPYGYGPRPSYYYRYPPPPPARARRVTDRPFTIGGGIGFGGLKLINDGGSSTSQSGMAYTARLGFGLAPGLILMWDIEGSIVDRGPSVFSQTAHLAALQIFVGDRFFLKGGFGLAQVNQDDFNYSTWGGALIGGVGLELIQGWNWSLDIESTVTAAKYTVQGTDETWLNWSIANFAINFF